MNIQFRNRAEAGRLLAQKLMKYTRRSDIVVLGMPRGGVPVAYEIAQYIDAPLDLFTEEKPATDISGRTVILVTDGIPTGVTLTAAIATVRKRNPARIAVAVPVVPTSTYNKLCSEADEVFALIMPLDVHNVSEWYIDFPATTDAEVRELIDEASHYLNESTF